MLTMRLVQCLPSSVSAWWTTSITSGWATSVSTSVWTSLLVFWSVDWVVLDWDGDNMRLNDDWVSVDERVLLDHHRESWVFWNLRDFDWNVDGERYLNFLDDWDFDLLVDWVLLDMMMVNGMNMVWDWDLNVFAVSKKHISIMFLKQSIHRSSKSQIVVGEYEFARLDLVRSAKTSLSMTSLFWLLWKHVRCHRRR